MSTSADRMRLKRARDREEQEQQLELAEQEIRDRHGYGASETRSQAERQATAERIVGAPIYESREELYVAHQVAITKWQMEHGLKDVVDSLGRTRLQRSEAYARWRWRSYHDGNVASL